MIPQEVIDEIKEKAEIEKIVSEYVQLRKRGKNFLGLCPFHSEKTPSFTVSPDKKLWHCFGCGEGGNLFTFIMKMERVEFVEALRILGEKLGIPVEIELRGGPPQSYREKLLAILDLACKYFKGCLDSPEGAQAKEYIKKRGLSLESLTQFKLGYAPEAWDGLLKHLLDKGCREEDILRAGLTLERKEGSGFYDRFRGRLIFPIFDLRGRTIGFGGRALKDEEPKYLNSPDSPVFLKGNNLYGLNFSKESIKRNKFGVLVEGYMDFIACYQAGIPNVVAPLGTSFTFNQARLLKRFAEIVILAFDTDSAGEAAAERSYEILRKEGIEVRVADLKDKKDPDEFIKAYGKQEFIKALKQSLPALKFKIQRALKKYNLNDIESRSRAAYEIAGTLSKIEDPFALEEYEKYAASELKINAETLASEVRRRSFYKSRRPAFERKSITKPPSKIEAAEKSLIKLAAESEQAFNLIQENLNVEDFVNQNYKEIMKELMLLPAEKALESLRSEEQKKILRTLMLEELPKGDFEKMTQDCINALKSFHLKEEIQKVLKDLEREEKKGNLKEVKRLNSSYIDLSEIYRGLSR